MQLNSAVELQVTEDDEEGYAPCYPDPEDAAEHPLYDIMFSGGDEAVHAFIRTVMVLAEFHIVAADLLNMDPFEYLDARSIGIMKLAGE